MVPTLETARIRLREFSQEDLDPLVAMVTDEDQMRYYPRPKTRAEAYEWIERNLTLYRDHGFGFWFMESVEASEFLGYCGIRPLLLDGVDETEVGWHIHKDFWNRGLATEAGMACRDLAFTRFDISRLVGLIDPGNVASIGVAERIGMCPERRALVDEHPYVVYSVGDDARLV